MNSHEISLVKSSFKKVAPIADQAAAIFYARLFELDPSLRALFHGDMADHRPKALRVDQAITALIRDLRQRGLLDQTLIAVCTEFGRTPWTDGPTTKGRNHYAKAFSCLLAGAGVRGGMTHGETDDFGVNIIKDPVHVHDYHATILHLMGIDHLKLTYLHGGRDERLTDVGGRVLTGLLA